MPVTSPVSDDLLRDVREASARPLANRPAELGVLVCEQDRLPPFAEHAYIRRLCAVASKIGLGLFAFDPSTWNSRDDSVKGWSWDSRRGGWTAARRGLPAAAYDRAWPETAEEKRRYRMALSALRGARRLVLLNAGLPNKAKVYDMLGRDRKLSPLLPPTAIYEGTASLESWLRRHGSAAFLKPIAGSKGKRTMAVALSPDGSLLLNGRDDRNRPLRRGFPNGADGLRRLDRWLGGRSYLMQPLLDLSTPAGEPCDVRALMQKDRTGRWTVTGVASRVGSPGMATANLHGGGKAASARTTLALCFGESRAAGLLEDVRAYSRSIAVRLEQSFGRFAELGLDYGIERNGKLWFLEANSKPGRAAMESAGREASLAAAEKPLLYAKSILLRPPGRVIHEFDHL